ncbi:putative DNA binding domain-containing protein [bacterium]|nr:putative DNA binding domain-containing protein [bacterium]MBU1613720.1 putative DNA binding domain-containing protein [bacterium]
MRFRESEKAELKKSTAELKQALEDLCAFANTGQGTLCFGISDKGEIVGQEISDNTLKRVSTSILSLIEPRLYPNIYTQKIEGKDILIVEVKNGPERPYFYKGKAYKRVGTTNAYLSRYEIEKYLYERENPAYRFDKTTVKEYKAGVAAKTLKWFLKKAKEERNLPVNLSESRNIILGKLGLLTQDKLNFAGLMAFGKEIQRHFPDTIVKCALFEGIDKTGRILDHIEIKDNIFNQIDYAENFILRNIRKSAWINPQTARREEQYELPYLAIREAVANAVAHRDYRMPSHIDVAIFDDRVEVWSPGGLPLGIEMKDLFKKHISVLRNPAIAEVLFLAGYIERWGTGIDKMNGLMQEYELPIPEYEEISGSFVVVFRRKEVSAEDRLGTESVPSLSQVGEQVGEQVFSILKFCNLPRAKKAILAHLNLSNVYLNYKRNIYPLVKKELLKMTISDKPQSSKQRYVITEKGRGLLGRNLELPPSIS